MKKNKFKIEIVKTGNENLIVVKLLEPIINDTKSYIIESVGDVDCEEFNLQDEIKDLCKKIFSIEGVFEMELHSHQVLVFKEKNADWEILEPQIILVFEKFLNFDTITIDKRIWFKVTDKGKSLIHRAGGWEKGPGQYYNCNFDVFVQIFGQLSRVFDRGLIEFVEETIWFNKPVM